MNTYLSIIIPTFNVGKNIRQLIHGIHQVMYANTINYEIIFVDDHSNDATQEIITQLTPHYPVKLVRKKGKKGKAQSLLEGFSNAQYDLLCIVDNSLQYPLEAIPAMVKKIENGADLVIANRNGNTIDTSPFFANDKYHTIFHKFLHEINVDVHSQLKVFKKEIIERIHLKNNDYSFDLALLLQTKNAGYTIATHDIAFTQNPISPTKAHSLKLRLLHGFHSLKLKFRRPDITAFHPSKVATHGQGFHYKGREFIHHSHLHPSETAFHRLSGLHIFVIIMLVVDFFLALIINWHITLTLLMASITFLYFADLLFNLYLILRSFSKPSEIVISKYELAGIDDQDWPTYTVFCPLYKEAQIVPQFVTSMDQLDYPKEKLQVMLILEEDDLETIQQIGSLNLPAYFEIVVVPHSLPKTKPKACNYALTKARGEYVVIYDAEDIPDPLQLKKAILAFRKAKENTICIQAKLNFYNPHQNLLTRVFTAEYSLWFDLVLTGLQSIHAPIPLGGTSNHFKRKDLHLLKGWDSFNVTEDADLGMRLVKQGYQTAIIDSLTLEEANSSVVNWFGQRSRWIKGYMQTYLVHIRNLEAFVKNKNIVQLTTFQLIIGGKVMSMFINPLMWIITISYFAIRGVIGDFVDSFFPTPILYMGVASLIMGNFLYLYYYMIGCVKHGHDELVKYVFLVPIYWLAMSVAAWMALYKLTVAPHHWAKTKHGLHFQNKKVNNYVLDTLGGKLLNTTMTNIEKNLAPTSMQSAV